MRHISERESDLPDSVIGELIKIAQEDKSIISMGAGQPDFKTPKPILDYAKKVINKSTAYSNPQGVLELREAIARKLKKENKISYADPKNIVVTAGSQESIFMTLASTIDPGEQVIIPNPGYLAYVPAVELLNGSIAYVRLREEDGFEIDPEKIKEVIDKKKTKVLILNSPANPTGNVLSKKILEKISDIVVENDIYAISDEAYEKLVYDKKHISIGSLNGMEEYIITVQSFSKSFAMCGFRLGYACGPKKIIDAITKSGHYVTLCPPHISQLLGVKALQISNKYVEHMRREYDRRRKYIVPRLNKMGLKTAMPYGAFYAFSNIKHLSNNSYKFAKEILEKTKVAVVPGTEFGSYGEGYIRFSYATDLNFIKKGLDRIENYLKKNY
ncbi:pyridoxal phosphate-dependent aminotransferase [Candidatus Woesearchaeota archaeon]|nr:pyridoxal phosphate-dependent aminotransferase [Candidatus Woesearchaeota archaeon]